LVPGMRISGLMFVSFALIGAGVRASTIGAEVTTGVCLFRSEDNGYLNIYPARIRLDGKEVGGVMGGAYRCFELTPGTHIAEVLSADPYDRSSSNPNAWRSKELHFAAKMDTKAFIEVSPGTRAGSYVGPWLLKVSDKLPDTQMFPQS
jgi:hypothetical protein